MINIDQALLNPSEVFVSPHDVVSHQDLSHSQKVEVLRRWALDAQALQVAEDENMTAPPQQRSSRLDEVMNALHELGETLDPKS
jgi:hypothetical protein